MEWEREKVVLREREGCFKRDREIEKEGYFKKEREIEKEKGVLRERERWK